MSKKLAILFVAALTVGGLTVAPARAVGPTNAYYLTDGDSSIIQVGQSGTIVRSWATAPRLYPLAVTSTVKLYNRGSGSFGNGAEYTLSGVPTGVIFPWQSGPTGELLDGGTDGVAHNYASEWNGGRGVWQYGLDWTAPVRLFTTSVGTIGVTYDQSAGSLWISQDQGNIQRVTDSGVVLSQFNPGAGRWGALAWEPSTDTLWALNNSSRIMRQWSKGGALLQEVAVPGLSSNIWGGEFAIAPEPSTISLLVVGAISLLAYGWRRRRAA